MKKGIISAIYAALLPYLIIISIGWVFWKSDVSGLNLAWLFGIIILLCAAGIAACIVCNFASLTGLSDFGSALRNFIIKLFYIPAHLAVAAIVSGFMNPFLLLLSWVPALMSVAFLLYSGGLNVGACIRLVRSGKCSVKSAVLYCVLSFIFIGDIMGAILQIKTSRSSGSALI